MKIVSLIGNDSANCPWMGRSSLDYCFLPQDAVPLSIAAKSSTICKDQAAVDAQILGNHIGSCVNSFEFAVKSPVNNKSAFSRSIKGRAPFRRALSTTLRKALGTS
jgi:hypothetical protein